MSLYFALLTVENNKNKKSVKFQGDILNFGDFIYVFVFTTNHHLNALYKCGLDSRPLWWFGHISKVFWLSQDKFTGHREMKNEE